MMAVCPLAVCVISCCCSPASLVSVKERFFVSCYDVSDQISLNHIAIRHQRTGLISSCFLPLYHPPNIFIVTYNCEIPLISVELGGPTVYSTVVTLSNTRFSIQQFYVLPTQCTYVFCMDLRTNSEYYPILC